MNPAWPTLLVVLVLTPILLVEVDGEDGEDAVAVAEPTDDWDKVVIVEVPVLLEPIALLELGIDEDPLGVLDEEEAADEDVEICDEVVTVLLAVLVITLADDDGEDDGKDGEDTVAVPELVETWDEVVSVDTIALLDVATLLELGTDEDVLSVLGEDIVALGAVVPVGIVGGLGMVGEAELVVVGEISVEVVEDEPGSDGVRTLEVVVLDWMDELEGDAVGALVLEYMEADEAVDSTEDVEGTPVPVLGTL
ncbi:uncharacterized protein PG986_006275 [Apiospora aurea]|uniref:Uncharacterized protein n=1 Tax=Apiospora aurea TaxID=335848 RepID=A0ABR1QJZ2_9PEZI